MRIRHKFNLIHLTLISVIVIEIMLLAFLYMHSESHANDFTVQLNTIKAETLATRLEIKRIMDAMSGNSARESNNSSEVSENIPLDDKLSAEDIIRNSTVVAHGMGATGDTTTLNCLEGFLSQYEKGVRVFEVDLRLTRDGKVVLRHDWRLGWQNGIDDANIPTLEKFLSEPILDKYTPLSFRDLLLLMEQYPDIAIITDTKFTDVDVITIQFDSMMTDAKELGLTYLFNRIIVQVYSGAMRQVLDTIYPFPYRIYTLYAEGFDQTEEAFCELAAYCQKFSFLGITMSEYYWDSKYAEIAKEYGISIYVHTVNDPSDARALLDSGVNAVYSDSLCPDDLSS